MIVKMKKYNFLIYHKEYQDFLLKLRDLGMVHVVQKQIGTCSEETELTRRVNLEKRYHEIIKNLKRINAENGAKELTAVDKNADGEEILKTTELLFDEKDKLLLDKQGIQKEIDRMIPLGDFEPENVFRFEQKGWYIHFYSISESKFNPQWIDEHNAIKISTLGSQLFFATFTKSAIAPPIEADPIRVSEKSISKWKIDLEKINHRQKEIVLELAEIAKEQFVTLCYNQNKIKDLINFEKVELSGDTAAGEKLMLLEGYVPEENEPLTTEILSKESIYFTVTTPTPEDSPPIKLKNNKFFRAFEIIADLYDKPNYNAFDFTPFFAPFYIIFFGLCLGDAGYGLIFLIASFFLRRMKDGFMRTAGQLATYFGIGTIVFGFASGTFFGIELLETNWNWLQPFKERGLIMDKERLFFFALIMGGIQIVYAIIIRGITRWMRFGFFYSLDAFGWLITMLGGGLYLMGSKEMITPVDSTVITLLLAVGGFMMLFFNNPAKGLKGVPGSVGAGLFGLYNKITGLLGDLLSYIRLFALGISGAVMGLVFNDLAVGLAPDIIIARELVMVLILLFGHGINIFINSLGAFIHPVRLTFVEFYNNVGFEGGGKTYTPFTKQAE